LIAGQLASPAGAVVAPEDPWVADEGATVVLEVIQSTDAGWIMPK
jgi:hypothetical protein